MLPSPKNVYSVHEGTEHGAFDAIVLVSAGYVFLFVLVLGKPIESHGKPVLRCSRPF